MMGYPGIQSSDDPPHLYSQELQLKLYQAFIFSIPILFSIILFLLFYLFYLKRRFSASTMPPNPSPRTSNQAFQQSIPAEGTSLKRSLKATLLVIVFDEKLRMKDSQCCVCLGDFQMKEELHQIPSCKHVFHADCIRHWLHSNFTCPLCRCSVITNAIKDGSPSPMMAPGHSIQVGGSVDYNPPSVPQHDDQLVVRMDSNLASCSRECNDVQLVEGSSSTRTDNLMCHINEDSGFVCIQIPDAEIGTFQGGDSV